MSARIRAVLVVCALATMTGRPAAQDVTTGTIQGRIVDAQGLTVSGAAVTATGPQGTRTAATDGDGRFSLPFLTPGVYAVRVERHGFKAVEQPGLSVRLGQRMELRVRMDVGGLDETVEVTAAVPVIDTSTTTIGAVIDSDLLERVPVGRTLTDALYLAPGVSSGGDVGRANPSIAGSSGLENHYVVDGVNITHSGYGANGSYSIVFGSLGSGLTLDLVKEIQVKTAGYEAEYGQSTGGVVNVVTRSGANTYAGSAFSDVGPEALEGTWTPLPLVNATQTAAYRTGTRVRDAGLTLGGPILRDTAFVFGSFHPQWETARYIALPGFPLRDIGAQDRTRHSYSYSAKWTLQIARAHRLDVSFFGDPAKGERGPQRTAAFRRTDTKGFSEISYGGHNRIVKYDGIMASHWLLEGSFARARNTLEEVPSVDEWQITDRTSAPHVATGGLGAFEANDGVNTQYQAKTTGMLGRHQIRGGIQFEQMDYLQGSNRTGPPITTHDGTRTQTGAQIQILPAPELAAGRVWRVTRANFDRFRTTEQQYLTVFVQDTWQPASRLTIRPGLRYEQQTLLGNLAQFVWDGNWAPRLGVTYDPTSAGRSKVYGHWGRFFAKIPNDLAARALSADAGVTRGDYYDADLTQPIPSGVRAAGTTTHYLTAGLQPAHFDADSKSTFMDETVVGVEYEAWPRVRLGVRYIHSLFGRVLEDVGPAPMISYFLPEFEDQLGGVTYVITNPSPDTPVVAAPPSFAIAFEEALHDYDAVEFTADKRFADRWGLQASYRWSRLYGTFEGFYRNDNGQSDPAITSLFDFPVNDPSYVALGAAEGFRGDIRLLGKAGAGPLPNDRPHQGKAYGSYAFDNGVTVGLGLVLSSGTPLTALAANPAYDSPGEIPETPRGGGFETVDGFRTRAPLETSLDVHADYTLALGRRRLVLLAEAFNLFDQQAVTRYDNYTEASFHTSNPDFGLPWRFQAPRQVRLGLRVAF